MCSNTPSGSHLRSTGEARLALRAQDRRYKWPEERHGLISYQQLLGKGSFGEVFLASFKDPEYDSAEVLVACKRIFRQAVFEHEVQVLCQVQHENIVAYFGDYTTSLGGVIVTEYIDGGSLEEYIRAHDQEPLPDATIHLVANQLACAIQYLHSKSPPIIHRCIFLTRFFGGGV